MTFRRLTPPTIAPIITIKNGATVTNSRDVAAYFGKAHHTVLEAVDTLIEMEPSIAQNFLGIEVDTKVGFGTRKDRAFDMTRDGFTLLAMGFTGKKALAFKLKYIDQQRSHHLQLPLEHHTRGRDRQPAVVRRG